MAHASAPPFRRLIASQISAASDALRRGDALRLKREFDLSQVECRTIVLIEFMQPVRLREVCTESNADKAQISRIVAELVRRGLVMRREFVGDARSAMLELTSTGAQVAVRLKQLGDEREAALRAALGEVASDHLLRAISVVRDKASQLANEEESLVSTLASSAASAEVTQPSGKQTSHA